MRHVPRNEGFILINAVWLLLLCGAIAALIMLRGIERGSAARAEGEALSTRLALESGVEAVIADILFNGPRSRWAMLPANGSIDAGRDSPLQVRVSSETGRLDLNDGNLDSIDLALRSFGIDATRRRALVDQLRAKRARQERIGSWAEAEMLLTPIEMSMGGRSCLDRDFTLYSGLSKPRPDQASPRLAHALGIATAPSAGAIEPGSAIRIAVSTPQGLTLTAVARIIGARDDPYVAMRWDYGALCQ